MSDVSDDGYKELPQDKCGLPYHQYIALLSDESDWLLEESAQLQDEEAGVILHEEAAEAAEAKCCTYLTEYA